MSGGPITSMSLTVSQPVGQCQVVSRTIVPGTYRRESGTVAWDGPNRKEPAERSRRAPKMLGESGRGRHSHSIDPSGASSVLTSQSERNAYSAMGGKVLMVPADPLGWRGQGCGRCVP